MTMLEVLIRISIIALLCYTHEDKDSNQKDNEQQTSQE
jgi:hypothetical protein